MKRAFVKVFTGTVVAITLIFNISGCNNKKLSESKTNNDNKQVTLKMVWWGNDQRADMTNKVIELFKQKHPNINFETQNYASTGSVKLNLAMNAVDEAMPDIAQIDYSFFTNFAERKLFEPLNPYIEQKILNVSDVDKSYLESGMKDGQLYGVNLGVNAWSVIVNPSVFKKAGVSIPQSGYTYDDMYQIAKELKAKINEPDFYPLNNFVDFNNYIRSTGGTYYNLDGTGLGYEDDKVFIDYLKLNKKWLDEGLISPTSATVKAGKDSLIVTGKSAFNFQLTSGFAAFTTFTKEGLQIISVPSMTKGKIATAVRPSMFFCVSSYSNYKKEAVQFLDFFINDIDANNIIMGDRGVPISAKVSENLLTKVKEGEKKQYEFMKFLKDYPNPIDPPSPSSVDSVTALFSKLSPQVLNGTMAPEEAAKQFRSGANKILKGIKGE